jgi:hypothetical protein
MMTPAHEGDWCAIAVAYFKCTRTQKNHVSMTSLPWYIFIKTLEKQRQGAHTHTPHIYFSNLHVV